MSKPYKIFGHQNRGIDTYQGRNVQLPMSIQKKPQSLNDIPVSERYQMAPFSGYNTPSHQNQNHLAYSQVSDPSLNQQLMKKIIHQQLERQSNTSRNRNQINIIRTQIRSVKQFVQEIGQKSDKNLGEFEQIRGQLYDVMTKIIDDYKIQSAKNLRQVVKKINQNVRKQCIGHLRTQYAPIAYIQDAEKQFNQLQDRIILLESKGDHSRSRISEDPVVLAQTIDLRLKKTQRQVQSIKKQINQAIIGIKQIQLVKQTCDAIKKKQQEVDEDLKTEQKLTSRLKLENQNIQKDISKIMSSLEQLKKQNSHFAQKLTGLNHNFHQTFGPLQEFNKKITNGSGQFLDIKDFLSNSKHLTYSGLFEHQKSSQSKQQKNEMMVAANHSHISEQQTNNVMTSLNNTSIKEQKESPSHVDIFQSPKKHRQGNDRLSAATSPAQIPLNYQQISSKNKLQTPTSQAIKMPQKLSPQSKKIHSQQINQQKQQQTDTIKNDMKTEYRIDSQNHLLDQNNHYILDSDGGIVTLTTQQVELLRKSTLVKLQE